MAAGTFPELVELESIIATASPYLEVRELARSGTPPQQFPLYLISLGNRDPALPAVGFFGGVHGLERIGSRILLSYLKSLVARLRWDIALHRQLAAMRLVFMPIVNPAGMWQATRCNPCGVDLMRNAPIDAVGKVPWLIGGQRHSRHLPWFRGPAGAPMEIESAAVCEVVREELLSRRFSLALDCHSGFGMTDRIWFPYARTAAPIAHLAEIGALEQLFSESYPTHTYLFEPQSRQYLAHGDLWDYLYLQAAREPDRIFLPLTLEMGSWRWIKKSPWQLLLRKGIFNPLPPHRINRVLGRHLLWLDFVTRVACNHAAWLPTGAARQQQHRQAMQRWYDAPP